MMFIEIFDALDLLSSLFEYIKSNKDNVDLKYLYSEVAKSPIETKYKQEILLVLEEQLSKFDYKLLLSNIMLEMDLYIERAE